MPRSRPNAAVLLLVAATACTGVDEPPPGPAPEPQEEVAPEPPEPIEPELTLEERWAAPFAVLSSGRTAARLERPVVEAPEMEEVRGPAGGSTDRTDSSADSLQTDPARDVSLAAESEEAEQAGRQGEDEGAGEEEEEQATSGAARTHRVEWGETWLGLARRFGVSTAALAALNPDVDPERLRAGEMLLVPDQRTETSAGRTHTVVAGDSLWGISRLYGVSIERLQEVNRLEGDRVRIGQVLIIP